MWRVLKGLDVTSGAGRAWHGPLGSVGAAGQRKRSVQVQVQKQMQRYPAPRQKSARGVAGGLSRGAAVAIEVRPKRQEPPQPATLAAESIQPSARVWRGARELRGHWWDRW